MTGLGVTLAALLALSCPRLGNLFERQSYHVATLVRDFNARCRPALAMELNDPHCRILSSAIIEEREDMVAVAWALDHKQCPREDMRRFPR